METGLSFTPDLPIFGNTLLMALVTGLIFELSPA